MYIHRCHLFINKINVYFLLIKFLLKNKKNNLKSNDGS